MQAGALWQGAHVRKADGSYGIVTATKTVARSQPMYDLTVDTAHTFFVGSDQWLVHNTSQCRRPSGYETFDVDLYEDLSPTPNRAPGHTNTIEDNLVQAHHPIQDQWAKVNIAGYDSNEAPATLLTSRSGLPHAQ